ncbi:hypothetical protein [Nesterenkonia populi]|uniref:hypothetical protein n=1 Tax=Nesterenkonia populi TaxID=1591087 RepID=UPI0011BEDE9B|nr:hypothetical protein [Nesterenkonia populi]
MTRISLIIAACAAALAVILAVLFGARPAMAAAAVLAAGFMIAVAAQVLWGAGPHRLQRTFAVVSGLAAGSLAAGAGAYVIDSLLLA